ncbi:hypothetical protein F5B22DRAFT_639292 [Xylaria bambusicola]|uniref:uncharacterized protein n=1 Tax=Xylaria bambusicola TaxID=326684 RepID=UPI0020076527|nr:uncharacterized protein F5B22DRAFT_639292 [Xylaria bambusicola]KAI0506274.1 hypothetical protein F5B22DRAFT_639292 [Xylaria bambusicola]
MGEFHVGLFGSQITDWTPEILSAIRSSLLSDERLQYLCQTILDLPSLWPLLKEDFGILQQSSNQIDLEPLLWFARGEKHEPCELSNAHFATITVIFQIIELSRMYNHDLPPFKVCQGSRIGFLLAAAFSSAKDWEEFKVNACNAVRLATCIGIVIDSQKYGSKERTEAYTISVRCKSVADRAYLDACLGSFAEAYISCITDDDTLLITLPETQQEKFRGRLSKSNLSVSIVGIQGYHHHSSNHETAQKLIRMSIKYAKLLGLPDADKLRLPLRSTADAQIIAHGSLSAIAIDLMLCKCAHWYQTVRASIENCDGDHVSFSVVGRHEGVIPLSLQHKDNLTSMPLDSDQDEVAITGMACRFPRAECLHEFWQLLVKGENAFGKLSSDRFNTAHNVREPKLSSFHGNFLNRVDMFDHRFFSVSGREAKSMDPQQRLALEVAYEALESSGYFSRTPSPETDVGCYLGVGSVDYEQNVISENANSFSAIGTLRAFISGRISHLFGWKGPSMTLDTACSSSAVAIHTACRALLGGECTMAIAGGVNIISSPYLHQNLAAAAFLHPTGPSKAFDATVNGYCRGEGAGMIVLKRLSRAQADGDNILGVIASSSVSQGSNSTSLTAPDSASQTSLYNSVLARGYMEASDVGYVEAHGTGTIVGDPIEYESIRIALTGSRERPLYLGTVKDNIGHTEAASGVASVIKVLLMIQHEVIPKQANLVSLNPTMKTTPEIIVPTKTCPWICRHQHVALVNNYGASGSISALLIRSHSKKIKPKQAEEKQVNPQYDYPIMLSGKTASHVQAYIKTLKAYLSQYDEDIDSFAYNIARKHNASFRHRVAFTATDAKSAQMALGQISDDRIQNPRLPIVLCFGGQTGKAVKVSKQLYDSCGLFQQQLDQCDAICQSQGLPSIYPYIFKGDVIDDPVHLHIMLLSLQVSSAKTWIECGLEVGTVIGHSFGQLAALCIAGSISTEDCFRFVSGRARLIRDRWGSEHGSMLSLDCVERDALDIADEVNKQTDRGLHVDIACYNGPRSFVLAGDALSIAQAEAESQKRSIKATRLSISHAYHSSYMDNILEELTGLADSITVQSPTIHIETCTLNQSWTSFTGDNMVRHSREPVYFSQALERIATRFPSAVWLEAGSLTPIIPMVRRVISKSDRTDILLSVDLADASAISNVSRITTSLWSAGSVAQFWLFHPKSTIKRPYKFLNLPPYQFDKSSHWIELKLDHRSSEISFEQPSLINLIRSTTREGSLFLVDTANFIFDFAVRGHAVAGQSLCPASMYIELAALAACSLGNNDPVRRKAVMMPHIEDLTMSAALGLAGQSALYVHLRLAAEDSWHFSIFSCASGSSQLISPDSGTDHAKGKVSFIRPDSTLHDKRLKPLQRYATEGLKHLASFSDNSGVHGPLLYELFSQVVTYADYYQGVKRVLSSKHEAYGMVTMPPQLAEKGAGHDIHGVTYPIIMDNFLQVAGLHVNCLTPRNKEHVYVCTAVEEVIITSSLFAETRSNRSWEVYTRYESGDLKPMMLTDIFACDPVSGKLIVAILGATFKSVALRSLIRELTRVNQSQSTRENSKAQNKDSHHIIPHDMIGDASYQTKPSLQSYKLQLNPMGPFENNSGTDTLSASVSEFSPQSNRSEHQLKLMCQFFADILDVPITEITGSSTLSDLGVDSLLVSEILSEIRSRFSVIVSQNNLLNCSDVLGVSNLVFPDPDVASTDANLLSDLSTNSDRSCPREATSRKVPTPESISGSHEATATIAYIARQCFATSKSSYDGYALSTRFNGFYGKAFELQSQLAVSYVVEAFATAGCDLGSMPPGHEVGSISFIPKHSKLVSQLYKLLADSGLIQQGADGASYRTQTPVPTSESSILHQTMLDQYPQHASETRLLRATGSRLADCLIGKTDPITLIFQDAKARDLLEDVYTNAPMLRTGTLLLGKFLETLCGRYGSNRELRILEVGAGTGGTSKHIIETLVGVGCKFSYTFTDLSPSLVAAAKRKFSMWSSFMDFRILDIEEEPDTQMLGHYDIILSSNCVHATKNLVATASNIRKLLNPSGILCLVELTRSLYWFDLVFGLLEGWWLFNDGREHALAHECVWDRCLRSAGFKWIDWSSSELPESELCRVIVASPSNMTSIIANEAQIVIKETMVFKQVNNLQLQADIYYPSKIIDASAKMPIALMIHGGGHVMLSREDIRPDQTDRLLDNGFIPISIDYRLCPETTLLDGPMVDVVDALAWSRQVLPAEALAREDVQVDAERIVAVGWSSGGHLALTLGYTAISRGIRPPNAIMALYCATDFEDPFWVQPNIPIGAGLSVDDLDEEFWTRGIFGHPVTRYNVPRAKNALDGWLAPNDPRSRLLLYMNMRGCTLDVLLGGLDKQTRSALKKGAVTQDNIKAASPLVQIKAGRYKTPTFIVHPRTDDLIPWQQSVRTYETLCAQKVEAELRIVDEGAPHLFDIHPRGKGYEAGMKAVREGYAFLAKHVGMKWT